MHGGSTNVRRGVMAAAFAALYLCISATALLYAPGAVRCASTAPQGTAGTGDETRIGHDRLSNFPRDLADVDSTAERKHRFLTSLQPVVMAENEFIARQRRWLLDTRPRLLHGNASPTQRRGLADLANYYRLPRHLAVPANGPVPPQVVDELVLRVDTLPPSLVMAQAAMESGWGTSRFVREGNNLFGQWVTGDTPGLMPNNADPSDGYRVAAYDTVAESVRSYLRNLNTHRAYRQLRRWRAELRAAGEPLDSTILSAGLVQYSQRGEAYVEELLRVIRGNRLKRYDRPAMHSASTRWQGALLARQ
jgi:Bax protein